MDIQMIGSALEEFGLFIICLGLPGIVFIARGVVKLVTGKSLLVGRDVSFGWRLPKVMRGMEARRHGLVDVSLGVILLLVCLLAILALANS